MDKLYQALEELKGESLSLKTILRIVKEMYRGIKKNEKG